MIIFQIQHIIIIMVGIKLANPNAWTNKINRYIFFFLVTLKVNKDIRKENKLLFFLIKLSIYVFLQKFKNHLCY